MAEHISSVKLYVGIWLALMVFTVLTVFAATLDLGMFNPIVALAIATTKAVLVVLFFMHVKYAHEKLTKLVIVTAIFFFLILLALTMADYGTRLWT
jgi:cytochrome c oxidase subunit IV